MSNVYPRAWKCLRGKDVPQGPGAAKGLLVFTYLNQRGAMTPIFSSEAGGFLAALFSLSGHLAHIAFHKSEAIFRTSLQVTMRSRQSQKEGKTRIGVGEGLPGTLAAGSWVRLATSQGSALYTKTSGGYGYHSKLCVCPFHVNRL